MTAFSKRNVCRALNYHADYDAVWTNQVPRRFGRRASGTVTGRIARRLFG